MGMSNISVVIGAIVGVFLALLIGLSLFGEIASTVRTQSTQGYVVNGVYTVDGVPGCTTLPHVSVATLASDGFGVATYSTDAATPAPVGCTTTSAANYNISPYNSVMYGTGAEVTVAVTDATTVTITAAAPTAGGARNPNDAFIATSIILDILPTVILVGLLAAGGVIGGFIGRAAGSRLG